MCFLGNLEVLIGVRTLYVHKKLKRLAPQVYIDTEKRSFAIYVKIISACNILEYTSFSKPTLETGNHFNLNETLICLSAASFSPLINFMVDGS